MALKTYVGARYAPKFMGAWNKSNEYAALSVVYNDNQSYVSRKTVPAETEITNTEYWIRSSDWNAQVDEYRNQVNSYDEKVVQYNQNVEAYNTSVNNFFNETIHAYNTKEDMVKDQSIKEGYTLITCGDTAIGDGSGAFYQAVTETSSGAVALENGLFAKKFQLMPERFNRWTVDTFGQITKLSLAKGDIITNANINNAKTTQIILPKIDETTYILNGTIKQCEYLGEYPRISYTPNLGDLSTFLLKSNNDTFLHFRIIEFMYNNTTLQVENELYLLPNGLSTNETPLVFNETGVIIGNISPITSYTLHMHGTPNSKIIIPYKQIGASQDSTGFLVADGYPTDFYVTISKPTTTITATSATPAPMGITNCTISMSGNETTISNITSFILPTALSPSNNSTYNFNLGNVGYTSVAYVDYSKPINLRNILIPFNVTASVTIKVNIGITGEAIPETEYQIPAGRSLFMLSVGYEANNHAFHASLKRFL